MSSNDTGGSADESADWGGEDTEESASEEDDSTVMETGLTRRQLTTTAKRVAENGADGAHGGPAAGGGDTRDAASAAANKVGVGYRHGATTTARERVAGRQGNPAGEPYVVGGEGEGRKVYRVAGKTSGVEGDGATECRKTPGEGGRQGVVGGLESPQGVNSPGMEALPQGDEVPGVDTKVNGVKGGGKDGGG